MVRNLFQEKVDSFYWPRRVQSEQGMENIGVARLMIDKFSPENVPHLTSLLVHNQRIERLWRDVATYIVQHYRDLFKFMESISILDPLNECELFALHLVYQPRLDKPLKDFISFWNNHKLRTERALTPVQIWMQGVYCSLVNNTVRDTVDLSDLPVMEFMKSQLFFWMIFKQAIMSLFRRVYFNYLRKRLLL